MLERRYHCALSCLAAGVGLILIGVFSNSPPLAFAALVLAVAGVLSAFAPFWQMPTMLLTGAAAAGGIALINSIGNLFGLARPLRGRLVHGSDRQDFHRPSCCRGTRGSGSGSDRTIHSARIEAESGPGGEPERCARQPLPGPRRPFDVFVTMTARIGAHGFEAFALCGEQRLAP